MNLQEFQIAAEQIRAERVGIRDAANLNLYQTFAPLVPPLESQTRRTLHAPDLAESWLQYFQLPQNWAERTLSSHGVRHGLELLFSYYARKGRKLGMPSDNYPVFGKLARGAKLAATTFPTLSNTDWSQAVSNDEIDILLLTNPITPLGRCLSGQETKTLETWLAGNPHRRLLIDAVYTFSPQLAESTLQLLQTNQTILLHSLTKGWLKPRLFGVALVPTDDLKALQLVFASAAPSDKHLRLARQLLRELQDLPEQINTRLKQMRRHLLDTFPHPSQLAGNLATGYLIPLRQNWRHLLEDDRILGVPASVFGSSEQDLTILSTLSYHHEID